MKRYFNIILGTHGLPDRLSKFNTFYKLLNEADNKLS
jgi:hypothetical protein